MASSLCEMASGKAKSIDKMTMKELAEAMKAVGVSDEGVETLSDARSRITTWSNEAQKTSNWSPGKAFSVLSDVKKEDDRKRQALLNFYAKADALLGEMDEQMSSLLREHVKNLKQKMRRHEEQLKQTNYFLLVAGEVCSGKSSLINLILDEEILPCSDTDTTSTLCELKFGEERRMVAHFKDKDPETGLDTKTIPIDVQTDYIGHISNYVHKKGSNYKKVELFWPHELLQVISCCSKNSFYFKALNDHDFRAAVPRDTARNFMTAIYFSRFLKRIFRNANRPYAVVGHLINYL